VLYSANLREGDFENGTGWHAKAQIGWNLRPNAQVALTTTVDVTPTLDELDEAITADVSKDLASLGGNGGDGGFDFFTLNIRASELEPNGQRWDPFATVQAAEKGWLRDGTGTEVRLPVGCHRGRRRRRRGAGACGEAGKGPQNGLEMRKTLEFPGFSSGEDSTRTTRTLRHYLEAVPATRLPIRLAANTPRLVDAETAISRPQTRLPATLPRSTCNQA
jgi:hypothetical protein